ncbi:MAG TPA: glycosyltransferase family 2 protein [Aquimonas sp.]|nr:glycosyltransferase family 2 protein [Aquimonas sp.]HRF54195.1 glycosyltransferase family 2 protein [Aquimonas sp.]
MSKDAAPERCVSAIVVTHHSDSVLMKSLHALERQPELKDIFVVDNGSQPSPIVPTRLGELRIELRCNIDNPGFAVACNQGAAAALSEYLLFVNPDCFLHDGALTAMLEVFEQKSNVGVVSGFLLEADGSPQVQARRLDPTPERLWSALRDGRQTLHPATTGANGVEQVEAVSGALMLMRRDVFHALGGFDTGYRLHFEDLDLCRRLRQQGYACYVQHAARALHLKGTSSRRNPVWVEWQKTRGFLRYFQRFDAAGRSAWKVLAWRLAIMLRGGLSMLLAVRWWLLPR